MTTPAPLSILDAIDDADVFAPWFRDRSTWGAWLAFLATLFGLPLTPEQLAIYRECTGRTAPPSGPFHEAWLICGRRAGKSFMLALVAVFLACFNDWTPFLVPGETGRIVIIAADRRQSRTIFGFVVGFLKNSKIFAGMIARETLDTIELTNGIAIEILTCDYRTVRGYSLVAALCDETAFWMTDEGSSTPDVEVIRSLRPALASVRGSRLLVASSPYAERGALWSAYRRHHGKDSSPVLTWQAPTRTMNPSIPESVISEAYESDPASASAEYGAQFRSDVSQLIERALLEQAVDRGVIVRPPDRRFRYVAFADPASGVGGPDGDRFGLSLGHVEGERIIIDYVHAWSPPFNASTVLAEACDVCRNYGVTELVSDRFSHGFVQAECQRNRMTWRPSELNKSQLYLNALPNLTSGRVRLLDQPRLLDEFALLERRPGSHGNHDKVDARCGRREDSANAVAGVILLLSGPQSSADNWIEYARRCAEEPWRRGNVDTDDIRARGGEFNWSFSSEQLFDLYLPEQLVPGQAGARFMEGRPYIQLTRAQAKAWLSRPAIAALNEALARELLKDKAA
jgi:hypothetical protein